MNLRPYQQSAVDSATNWMKKSKEPALLELATGAGKSWICAAIAHWIFQTSKKKVLCLQPSKELTEQNHEKYLATGMPASIFSASAGSKCMRHNVVYGTPKSVYNSIERFGDQFAAVIIDEAHGITPTIREIISSIKKKNENLRVIGMTATPYRMQTGYIYENDIINEKTLEKNQAIDPYFKALICRVETRYLINIGFLTNAHADPVEVESYDTTELKVNRLGKFDQDDVEKAFEGKTRLTSIIVEDIIEHAKDRKGVMLFAATVHHAKEILASLPPDQSMMLGGDINMKKPEREKLINDFKAIKYKYIVSVATLTTGFDAPHVDLIAVLRATESKGLFQQIIGRGLRLFEGKEDCLVLDYAGNVEGHGLQNDIFSPSIYSYEQKKCETTLNIVCPECSYENQFAPMKNDEGFEIDSEGYFVNTGTRYDEYSEYLIDNKRMPAHQGRRCGNKMVPSLIEKGVYEQCGYRWAYKLCGESEIRPFILERENNENLQFYSPEQKAAYVRRILKSLSSAEMDNLKLEYFNKYKKHFDGCNAENDITARYCEVCRRELIDPNEKLSREFARVKSDPYELSTDKILSFSLSQHVSQAGNISVKAKYVTEYRTFYVYYMPQLASDWIVFNRAYFNGHIAPDIETFMEHVSKGTQPKTITAKRKKGSPFYLVSAYNLDEDVIK